MKFESKTFELKTGETILIREAEISDAEKMIKLVTEYGNTFNTIPLTPGEFQFTIEQEEQWIESFKTKDNSLLIVAEVNGEFVGNLDLTGNIRKKMYHTAELGMSVLKSWQGKGVGRKLLEVGLQWAWENKHLEVVWLQVYEDNIPARSLYQTVGFIMNGVQANFFKEERGDIGNVIMTKYL